MARRVVSGDWLDLQELLAEFPLQAAHLQWRVAASLRSVRLVDGLRPLRRLQISE